MAVVDRVAETLRLGTCRVEVVEAAEVEGFDFLTSSLTGGLLTWPVDRIFDTDFGCTAAAFISRYFLVVGLSGAVKLDEALEINRGHFCNKQLTWQLGKEGGSCNFRTTFY